MLKLNTYVMYLIIAICFSSFAPIGSLYHNVYIFDHHTSYPLYVFWRYFISLIWLVTNRICNMLWIRIMSNKKNQWWAGNYHRSAGENFLSQQLQGYGFDWLLSGINSFFVCFQFFLCFFCSKWKAILHHSLMQCVLDFFTV